MVLKIGLTGGIGSGKSTVANLFAKLGVEIIDADVIAHQITQPGKVAYSLIIEHFGAHILNSDRQLDRKRLRQIIFANLSEKVWLEQTLHPLILQIIRTRILAVSTPYCVIVIPLLAEARREIDFIDRVCVVDAPDNLRKEWAASRDNVTSLEIEMIITHQSSSIERLAIADDLIINNQDLPALQIQVHKLHLQYLQMAAT